MKPASELSQISRKRKSPETGLDTERRPSPFNRRLNQEDNLTPSASRSSSISAASVTPSASSAIDVYNGVLDADDNAFIFCRPVSIPPMLHMHH